MTASPADEHYVTLDGLRTYVRRAGDGPPVVLLHGMAATSDIWWYTVDALKDDYAVYAPDLPAHGRSAAAPRPYSIAYFTGWLDALLDALGLGEVTLIGQSMGGGVGLAYSRAHPARVRRQVMVSPLGLGPAISLRVARHFAAHLADLFSVALHEDERAMLRLLEGPVFAHASGPARPVIRQMARLNRRQRRWSMWAGFRVLALDFPTEGRRRAFTSGLSGLPTPTLIVWGRQDGLLPVTNAARGKAVLPHAEIAILENSAHAPMLEEPEAFNQLVLDFIRRTP